MKEYTAKASLGPWRIGVGLLVIAVSWFVVFSDWQLKVLWPSLVALSLVFLWRRVLLGLLLGGFSGCVILSEGNPFRAILLLVEDYFLPIWSSEWKLGALAFTLILGGMAASIERGGGLQALLSWFLNKGRGKPHKRVQWAAFSLGLVCFFDGLANSMLVGRLMKSIASKAGVSGVKLAYIVDSTSSAVACLAVISTWIAYQLAMIREGYAQIGQEVDAYGLFIASIPLNFYCWFTLIFLAMAVGKHVLIGPMRTAEQGALVKSQNLDLSVNPEVKASAAIIPLVVLVGSLLVGLYFSGSEDYWPITWEKTSQAYGQADAAQVLVICSILAIVVALFLMPRSVPTGERLRSFASGSAALFGPVLVLIGAWVLGGAMRDLGTAKVIASVLSDELPVSLLPMLIFVTGAVISFCTGTSWGTMGILMPLSIPVVFTMSGGDPGALMPAVVAAVFSGAVFGDHCSPISDTTLVSSIACGVRPVEHVRTQMPYALIAAVVAILAGFLPVGLGMSGWLGLLLGIIILWVITIIVSKK